MYKPTEQTLGYFVEKDYKQEFTYRETKDQWALDHGFKHEFDVGFLDAVRFCNVKKTRVDVCMNEDDGGKPSVVTWVITKNVVFQE